MAGTTLFQAQKYFALIYLLVVVALAIPYFQSHVIYLNAIKLPLFADFNNPEKYGLAPNRTANLKIRTSDGEIIGAWFVLSDPYYHSLSSIPSDPAEHVVPALQRNPAILFLHGNAATRAFGARIRHYQAFTSRLGANVLAIDYRGFADSTGKPSEVGLVRDAKAAFDWLVAHGKEAKDILIIGHSLGTGVSGQLAVELNNEGIECRGIVLLSPFASIAQVLNNYNLFGFIPLIKPMSLIPGSFGASGINTSSEQAIRTFLTELIKRVVVHRFDTLQAVPNITASVLIAHAEDDWDIPDSHSDILFQAFLDPHLPPVDVTANSLLNSESLNKLSELHKLRKATLDRLVRTTTIPKFGRIVEFVANKQKVVLVKTLVGGHNYVGIQEGLVDIIGKNFGFL